MIYIVRHGQTEWNKIGRFAGQTDVELNQTGIQQAKQLANKLKYINFDLVVSSPLKRTQQTAQLITDKPIVLDERIIERCNGEFEGKYKKNVMDLFKSVNFNDPNENRFGIENIVSFKSRIYDFMTEITEKYKNKNVLIVTHSGVILYMRAFFEGEPEDKDFFKKFKTENCEVVEYEN